MRSTTFSILLILSIGIISCQKTEQVTTFTGNVPTYMSYDELRQAVGNDNDRMLEHPGKIFLYNDWILINEREAGIHVYDNSNPSSPQHMAFIAIPGNIDMAVREGFLFADSYVDLVAIDIRNPQEVREVGRTENVFSYTIPTLHLDDSYPVARIDQEKGVVIDFSIEKVEERCEDAECFNYYAINRPVDGPVIGVGNDDVSEFGGNFNNTSRSATSTSTAIAGSMARFLMVNDLLYAISNEEEVTVFDVRGTDPAQVTQFYPWRDANDWGEIETLFVLQDRLFIGSTTGMLAYDVSAASSPRYLSHYSHFTACDPVIANEDHAFVTLRGGNACGWNEINELQVLDIADIMNPILTTTFSMDAPQGLTMDDSQDLLFVCDGLSGIRVMDYAQLEAGELYQLNQTTGFDAYDVLLKDRRLHVIGRDGLHQFSYSDDGILQEISVLNLR